jgi:hypothetical protein
MTWDLCVRGMGAALGCVKQASVAAKRRVENIAAGEGTIAKTARAALTVITFLVNYPTDKKKSVAKILAKDALVGLGMAYGLKVSLFHPMLIGGGVLVTGVALRLLSGSQREEGSQVRRLANKAIDWSIASVTVCVPAVVPRVIALYSSQRVALIVTGGLFTARVVQLLIEGRLLSQRRQKKDDVLIVTGLMTSAAALFSIEGLGRSALLGAVSLPLLHLLEVGTKGDLWIAYQDSKRSAEASIVEGSLLQTHLPPELARMVGGVS